MTEETQGASPVEDAPLSPPETEAADSSPAPEAQPEAAPNEATPQPRDEDGKYLSRKAQERIDRLTWEKNEYLRQLQTLQMQQPKPEPKAEPKPPTLEEVGYDEAKYQAAYIDYARTLARAEAEAVLSQREQQQKEQTRLSSFAERQREFVKTTPDFEDKVLRDPTLPITETMRDVIVDSESGPEIAYYLANNRQAAEAIARLPTHLAALEMGRIEGRLQAQKEAAKRSVPPVSKAPPPPPQVETTEVEVEKDPDQMPIKDWVKWRNKQLSRKR